MLTLSSRLTLKTKVIVASTLILLSFTILIFITMTVGMNNTFHRLMDQTRENYLAQKKEYLKDLVLSAAQVAHEQGQLQMTIEAKLNAQKVLEKLRFHKGVGYFFAYEKIDNEKYIYAFHGVKKETLGKEVNLSEEYRQELIAKAMQGGGFVEYQHEKQEEIGLKAKLAYATYLPEWNWVIGAGIYVDDVEKEIEQLIEQEKHERSLLMLNFIFICLIFLLFMILMAIFVLGRSVEKILGTLFRETSALTEAARAGNLDYRAQEQGINIEFRPVLQGFNHVVDSFLIPVKESIIVLEKVSRADLSEKMSGEYHGEYKRLQDTLNQTIDTMNDLIYQAKLLLSQLSLNAQVLAESSGQLCEEELKQIKALSVLKQDIEGLNVNSAQMKLMTEIVAAMETIEGTGRKGLLSAEKYSATAELLADQALELSKIIGRFKLEN